MDNVLDGARGCVEKVIKTVTEFRKSACLGLFLTLAASCGENSIDTNNGLVLGNTQNIPMSYFASDGHGYYDSIENGGELPHPGIYYCYATNGMVYPNKELPGNIYKPNVDSPTYGGSTSFNTEGSNIVEVPVEEKSCHIEMKIDPGIEICQADFVGVYDSVLCDNSGFLDVHTNWRLLPREIKKIQEKGFYICTNPVDRLRGNFYIRSGENFYHKGASFYAKPGGKYKIIIKKNEDDNGISVEVKNEK